MTVRASAFCDIPVTQNIDPGTQDPDDPSNQYDVIITPGCIK